MIRRLALVLGLSTLIAAPAVAQVPLLDIRIGAQAVMPQGDLGDFYKGGFGAYGRVGVPLGMIKLMGTATFTKLPGKEVGGIQLIPDQSFFGITAGPHLALPLIDAGLEFGYFSEFKKMGFVPSVSIGLGKLDLMASYTMVNTDPKSNWAGLGVGLRF